MLPNLIVKERTEITKVKFHLIQNNIHRILETFFWGARLRSYGYTYSVISKACSVDHQWSRDRLKWSANCITNIILCFAEYFKFPVLSAQDKFGNFCTELYNFLSI